MHKQTEKSPLLLALSDIKLAHSVFAMPFALLAAVLSTPLFRAPDPAGNPGTSENLAAAAAQHLASPHNAASHPATWTTFALQLALVVICMFFARTWAMLVNRLADARFDAANPRTARRVFASGQLTLRRGWAIASLSAACFIAGATLFWPLAGNPWPAILSLPVLGWIALYSYTKRFTLLCHVFLGGALAASPLAAAIAIDPGIASRALTLDGPPAAILHFAGFILLWVAGFDVAYALQDLDFDRRTGLHSIPAALGPRGALWASRLMHAGAFVMLVLAFRADPRFGPLSHAALVLVGALLVYEHLVLARRGVAGLPIAFFTVNGTVSVLLGLTGIIDVAI